MYQRNDGEESKITWFDSLVQLGILAIAVYGVIQNRLAWVLFLLLLLVLQNHALLLRFIKGFNIKRRQRKIIGKYLPRFRGLVKQGVQFICNQNTISIPNRVRKIYADIGGKVLQYNSRVENLFCDAVISIQIRAGRNITTLDEFESISVEFFRTMDCFAMVYINDFSQNLKRAEGFDQIKDSELSDLRKCYVSFHHFVAQHNAYRNELSVELGQEANCLISFPAEVL